MASSTVTGVPTGPVRLGTNAHAVLRPATRARITGGLWQRRRQVNAEVSVPDGFERLEHAGNFHDLRLAAGTATGEYTNDLPFMDSDLYKWLEAVGWLRGGDTADAAAAERLDRQVDIAVELLSAAQQPDGYLQSYFQVVRPGEHFVDLQWGHELYCAGHLIQAALAHVRSTGRTDLLGIARRVADHIDDTFGRSRRHGVCGHPEIETALVELYRETTERRYLDLARYFVDGRGHGLLGQGRFGTDYWQDRVPVREATEVTGHSVRQLYLLAGVADVYLESGDAELLAAAERLWLDMVTSKTYLTGGIGAHHADESFGDPFELPSERAYAETCASIASIMFAWRMLLVTGRSRYAELMERTLYNGFLAGVSLGGDRFLYVNPLRVGDGHVHGHGDHGPLRTPWFRCACCPPNVMRLLASLEHYVAASDGDGLVLHQFVPGEYTVDTDAGPVAVAVTTEYPWRGEIDVRVEHSPDRSWPLTVRVPSWATDFQATVDGKPVGDRPEDGWLRVERRWRVGETLRVTFGLAPRLTSPDPRVDALRGCLAVERGPLVYCVESADHDADVRFEDLVLADDPELGELDGPAELAGVVGVTVPARLRGRRSEEWWPYAGPAREPHGARSVTLHAIPYYAWGNRAPGAMRVWLPTY